jgi:hypothetical protein
MRRGRPGPALALPLAGAEARVELVWKRSSWRFVVLVRDGRAGVAEGGAATMLVVFGLSVRACVGVRPASSAVTRERSVV